MLYNNFRRPILRGEHPGKCFKLIVILFVFRTLSSRFIKVDWLGVVEIDRNTAQGKLISIFNLMTYGLFRSGLTKQKSKSSSTTSRATISNANSQVTVIARFLKRKKVSIEVNNLPTYRSPSCDSAIPSQKS